MIRKLLALILAFMALGCSHIEKFIDEAPGNRRSKMRDVISSLQPGMTEEACKDQFAAKLPPGTPFEWRKVKGGLYEVVDFDDIGTLFFRNGVLAFSIDEDTPSSIPFTVYSFSNVELDVKKIFIEPVSRDGLKMTKTDPVFRKFLNSIKEPLRMLDIEVIEDQKKADVTVLVEWTSKVDSFEREISVPIIHSTYIPGSTSTTTMGSTTATTYTPSQTVLSYGGSRSIRQTEYSNAHILRVAGMKSVKQVDDHFRVSIGFWDEGSQTQQKDVMPMLFVLTLPYWQSNYSPPIKGKLPMSFPPLKALNAMR